MDLTQSRRIKLICQLGIGGRTLIPILLPEIRKIVPSYSSTFLWLDKTYKFVNTYDESPDSQLIINNYVNNYLDSGDLVARRSLNKWLRAAETSVIIATTEQLALKDFYNSNHYHEILKPLGYHHSLYAGLKIGFDPVGILILHRKHGEYVFSQKDKNNLQELSALIIQALRQKEYCSSVMPSKCEIGLLMLDTSSCPQQMSPQGRQLLFLATHPEARKGMLSPVDNGLLIPDEITTLVQNLCNRFYDRLPISQSPRWTTTNPWGSFTFQANWFQKTARKKDDLIAVTAQYEEPTLYHVMLLCDELGFTVRQTEVITQLLKGFTYDVIADELYVSPHTVADHVKRIYEKLGIHNRSELLSNLLEAHL